MVASILALSVLLGGTTVAIIEFFKKAAAAGKPFFVKIIGGNKTVFTAIGVGVIVGAVAKALLVFNLAALFLQPAAVASLMVYAGLTWVGFIAAGGYSGAIASGIVSLINGWIYPPVPVAAPVAPAAPVAKVAPGKK